MVVQYIIKMLSGMVLKLAARATGLGCQNQTEFRYIFYSLIA